MIGTMSAAESVAVREQYVTVMIGECACGVRTECKICMRGDDWSERGSRALQVHEPSRFQVKK